MELSVRMCVCVGGGGGDDDDDAKKTSVATFTL